MSIHLVINNFIHKFSFYLIMYFKINKNKIQNQNTLNFLHCFKFSQKISFVISYHIINDAITSGLVFKLD
jgi:hypothetical protein